MKKQITKKHPEGFIRISVSTEKKYFSITADLCIDQRFSDGGIFACGCLHDEILEVAPELKPFVDLHLSDLDGVPTHAEANGWYWLAKVAGISQKYEPAENADTCFTHFLNHSRLKDWEAREVIDKVQKSKDPRKVWQKQIDGLRPRWKSEADEALKLLESL